MHTCDCDAWHLPHDPRPRPTRKITTAVAAAVLALGAFAAGWWANTPDRPSCPTEDSCTADYRDGGWHVAEVSP